MPSSPTVTISRTHVERASRPRRLTPETLSGGGADKASAKGCRAAVGRVADVGTAEHGVGDPAHGNRTPAASKLPEEPQAAHYLRTARPTVGALRPRVGRHDVPEQHGILQLQLF